MLLGVGGFEPGSFSFLSVSDLTMHIRDLLRKQPNLQDVWVQGEILNFKHHTNGHMYFSLKDKHSRLKCVMFSGDNKRLSFSPQEGWKVFVRGSIDVYIPNGEYQLHVREMLPDGLGLKFLEFEQTKKKLEAEGLFRRKRQIPRFPERIGLVTSLKGAAVRDVLRTLALRYPRAEVILSPSLVQGEGAIASLLRALQRIREVTPSVDVLLVVRGGGGVEDLWAFNNEAIARALFDFPVPVITGIGHESDVTIADLVADLRASTPTGAAESAVLDQKKLQVQVQTLYLRMSTSWQRRYATAHKQAELLTRRRVLADPMGFLGPYRQTCDILEDRLKVSLRRQYEHAQLRLSHLESRLRGAGKRRLSLNAERSLLISFHNRLSSALRQFVNKRRYVLDLLEQRLESASPTYPLARGYAYLTDTEGRLLVRAEEVLRAGRFTAHMSDGALLAEALEFFPRTNEG